MNETYLIKKALRNEIKKFRKNMDRDYKNKLDNKIFENLLECKAFLNADTVLVYNSTEIEVSTEKIMKYCFEKNIKTALPRCFEHSQMKFYFYNIGGKLEKSVYGISEPPENMLNEVKNFCNAVCIVPALSCDKNGYRLGYGGGYYDRFLAAHEELTPIVICYSENMRKKLVHNEFDRKAAFIVSENGLEVCDE